VRLVAEVPEDEVSSAASMGSARGTEGPRCSQERLLRVWRLLMRLRSGPHGDGAGPRVEGWPGWRATPSASVDARGVVGSWTTTTTTLAFPLPIAFAFPLLIAFAFPLLIAFAFVGASMRGSRTWRAVSGCVGWRRRRSSRGSVLLLLLAGRRRHRESCVRCQIDLSLCHTQLRSKLNAHHMCV
jgi:hypothetical protein